MYVHEILATLKARKLLTVLLVEITKHKILSPEFIHFCYQLALTNQTKILHHPVQQLQAHTYIDIPI